jgi:hypothetical protein
VYNLNYAPTTLGYKVEWKSVSRGTGGKKVEYHWSKGQFREISTFVLRSGKSLRTLTLLRMLSTVRTTNY